MYVVALCSRRRGAAGAAHSGPDLPKMLRNLKLDVIVIDMGYDESINVSSKNLGL